MTTTTHFTKKVEFVPNLKKKLEEKITEDIEGALKFELERFEFQELLKKYELKASAEIYGLEVIYLYFIDKDGYRFDALDKFRNYFKILILPRIYEENGKYIIKNYIKLEPGSFDNREEFIKEIEKELKERFKK